MSKQIGIAIIEGCKHLPPDKTPCKMCIDAASIALGIHEN